MKRPMLKQVRISNFKAIRSSGAIRLSPFTVLIGDNGSGKSSLIEALETLQVLVTQGPDAAMQMWRGIEHVRHKLARKQRRHGPYDWAPIEFVIRGYDGKESFFAKTAINERDGGNEILFQRETIRRGSDAVLHRDDTGRVTPETGFLERAIGGPIVRGEIVAGRSLLSVFLWYYITEWQFLGLTPSVMGQPKPQTRTGGPAHLSKDGANVAEYLMDIRHRDLATFEGIVDTVKHVLPYASDIQPALTSELERTTYLQLTERDFKVAGWLLSSGTLRFLALLALLRHPQPPPLIFIEEIENGLDPRTIHLLVDEIRAAVESGRTQVIATTHSPYFLDLVPLESIILVERADGHPTFTRPADQKGLEEWAKRFAPGQLYTMDRLGRRARA